LFRVLFIALVASACSFSLFSICWNLPLSMAGESTTVTEGGQGIVGYKQGSFTLLCVGSFGLLSYTNQCPIEREFYCKGNLTDLRRILHLSLAKGNPK
jgi:hypothetical protein